MYESIEWNIEEAVNGFRLNIKRMKNDGTFTVHRENAEQKLDLLRVVARLVEDEIIAELEERTRGTSNIFEFKGASNG